MEDIFKDKWVWEAAGGFGCVVKVVEHLYHEVTPFQTIDIYETETVGRLLTLNGIIQLTEFDEFAYQEMMAHTVLMACRNPERVLVIGGGDGGVLREIEKHPEVKKIDICEIDEAMVKAAKKYLPSLSVGFEDERVTIHIEDGSKFIQKYENYYDCIIVDSTDPGGVGDPLFGEDFYCSMRKALRDGGVIGSQSESPFLLPEVVAQLQRFTGKFFDYTAYGMFYVPTYPMGQIGICIGGVGVDATKVQRPLSAEIQSKLRYYNEEIHEACFKLPQFVKDMLAKETD